MNRAVSFLAATILVMLLILVITKLTSPKQSQQPNTNLITIHTPVSTVYIYAIDIEGHGKFIVAAGLNCVSIIKE